MNADPLPYHALPDAYDARARALLDAFKAGEPEAESRIKWEHPRFRDRPLSDVKGAAIGPGDARIVVAHEHSFETWDDLMAFAGEVQRHGPVALFERVVELVITGDSAELRSALSEHPELARARSTRRHHATLLHYLGANGVEGDRQKTPANAVEIMKMLLDAGAEPDATADLYGEQSTTMSMVVSSTHPAGAGLQAALAETLLDYGAASDGAGSKWQSPILTALMFGYLDTARTLAARVGAPATLAVAAGLGRVDEAQRLLAAADGPSRHAALALGAQHGHTEIVRMLLDAGENPDRYNPDGYHSHSTPVHQAIVADQMDVVRLLAERGARLDIRDTIFHGTPLGWAIYCDKPAIAAYLRAVGAPEH